MQGTTLVQRVGKWINGRWPGLVGLAVLILLPGASGAADAKQQVTKPQRWAPCEPCNQPLGQARGICPGRVVWMHDPKAVQWDGNPASGGWFEDKFTDPGRVEQMFSKSLCRLTNTKTDAEAWKALFRYYNRTRRRGDIAYRPGEKVAVKLNLNCSKRQADPRQNLDITPQLTRVLLRHLVKLVGVREADIVVCDPSRLMSDQIFLPVHQEFPGIRFEDRDGGEGRFKVQPDKTVALHFGDPSIPDSGKTYLPQCFTRATYLINAAVMKGHTLAGVTLCAKNHFGSVFREGAKPQDQRRGWDPSNMHETITVRSRKMGTYNPMVDLMGHRDLGGKTVLYLIDGLYASGEQNSKLERWESSPFDGHWTASLFVSQDPVAIDSVLVDFFGAEKASRHMYGAVDNYLHEAALANKPPSGALYDPEGNGAPLESLGVHEHWNNPKQKQYSRNLRTGQGIELLKGE
jgi:hypothetical protein